MFFHGLRTGKSPCLTSVNHHVYHPHRIHGAGIYANIGGVLMVNVTIYSIHGSYRHSFCFFQYIFSGQNVSNRLGDFCLPESTRSFHYVSLLSWSLETMQKHGWLIVNICTDIDMYIVTYIYIYIYVCIHLYI